MRIAVVGAGISGLTVAHLLAKEHDLTVFEAEEWIGGHTHTVPVDVAGDRQNVDTGFIVFNERNYPNFVRLLTALGVASQPTTMSFSVRCDRTRLEYNGTSLNRLFAQRRNLFRPRFHRMIRDILRFHREAPALLATEDEATSVGEYLAAKGYSEEFAEQFLIPMGSALWSCPAGSFRQFPIRFVVEFFNRHAMLQVSGRPVWRTIVDGSWRYVEALTRPFRDRVRVSCPVRSIRRRVDRVEVTSPGGTETFDHVVIACHSDQALAILADASERERDILGAFPYQRNETVLHWDISVLPRTRRAWAAWNSHLRKEGGDRAAVTYNMQILQRLSSRHVFYVTLNEEADLDPAKVLGRFTYHHPVYIKDRVQAQRRRAELINVNRTSFCGAYWGYGFHEDGVRSGLDVCRAFGKSL
jgi:predicted NAD/FAD-binding protein